MKTLRRSEVLKRLEDGWEMVDFHSHHFLMRPDSSEFPTVDIRTVIWLRHTGRIPARRPVVEEGG